MWNISTSRLISNKTLKKSKNSVPSTLIKPVDQRISNKDKFLNGLSISLIDCKVKGKPAAEFINTSQNHLSILVICKSSVLTDHPQKNTKKTWNLTSCKSKFYFLLIALTQIGNVPFFCSHIVYAFVCLICLLNN